MKSTCNFVLALALAATRGSLAEAKLVGIEFRDAKPPAANYPGQGGPRWTGIVDTTADELRIYTWEEQPQHSPDFWTPIIKDAPFVWPAFDVSGAAFDVPDSFDGSIDGSFAFISTTSALSWSYVEGVPLLPAVADFFPGWGGARYIPNEQTELVYDVSWDETYMPKLITVPLGIGIVAADGGIVTVLEYATIQSVPEASPALVWSVLGVAMFAAQLWRGRRLNRA